jgi:aspartyl-tRNA(Asn)/glutamyl-tRNA(Gln) amidotransferase subunit A
VEPPDLTIAEAAARLRAGTLTAAALVEAHLARIAARDAQVHAVVHLAAAEARAAAAAADAERARGLDRGPLHGMPVGIKDLIDVAGLPTACGAPVAAPPAAADAEVVRRLRAAGAIPLGKLATDPYGLGPDRDGSGPPVQNPHAPGHAPGGSSSGPAAAVAAGLVRVALGTDTGGSVRTPAAWCGVVGLKPGFGAVPLAGVVPLAPSLDHVGLIAASVAEAALTLDAIADGPPASAGLDRPPDGLRLAYARSWAEDPEATPGVLAVIDAAVERLARLGVRVEQVTLPEHAVFEACGSAILYAEALATHAAGLRDHPDRYGAEARRTLEAARALDPAALPEARRAADALRRALDRTVFARFDAIATATALTPAPPLDAADRWPPLRTIAFNVTGHPALSVPAGTVAGLPVGLQIAGPSTAAICRLGAALERSTPALRP